ncbi:type 4 pilus major pilin [Acerihabitans sp. TG2]|uniref:type 4 pilus major pilin n=1 Tax=Acerihabitans sp. TG2 TaxID=3096008 RepID=UPI002B235C47|nr:type 4 pilus major pilin [Acerihabitans sp. TG2]MEA9392189.1 type 4 pilus major pilin [Acerihabitans sp. TG2]
MNTLTRFQKKKLHAGVTLIEILAGIVILGGMLYAIMGRVGTANESAGVNAEQGHIAMLSNGISGNLWTSSGYPTGDLYTYLKNNNLIPGDMTDTGTGIKNSYGGAVLATGASTYYTISYSSVPKQACNKLSVQMSKSSTFSTTTVNGTVLTGEVTPALSSTACNSDSNTLVWKSTI